MAEVLDPNNLDDQSPGARTYAIKIEVIDRYGVLATFYKFGLSKLSVKRRYAKDSSNLRITIQRIWRHATIQDAKAHEERLFKRYRPTCIFDNESFLGKTSGILLQGGNTEVFLADRLAGEKDVKIPFATLWVDWTFSGHLQSWWRYLPPNQSIYCGSDRPRWLEWLTEVPDGYMLLPDESNRKNRLIFIREGYLFGDDYFPFPKKREPLKEQAVRCNTFSEALRKSPVYL